MSQCKCDKLVYVPAVIYGYDIRCRHCGEFYGFSSDRDMRYLAGLNRNRGVVLKRGKKRRRVTGASASAARRPAHPRPRQRRAAR